MARSDERANTSRARRLVANALILLALGILTTVGYLSGAVADGDTLARGRERQLDAGDYLARSDSYSYFRALGDTVDTGPTDNNVRDLRLWFDFNS